MTPTVLRQGILEPTLDARALNLHQQDLVVNPTAEVDSIVEHLSAVRRSATGAQHKHLDAITVLLRELVASNRSEGQLECDVAAVADRLAADQQRSATVGAGWGANRTARELRAPLADLCNPVLDGARRQHALGLVQGVVGRVARDVLLSGTVRYQLGERKFAKLTEVLTGATA